MEPKSSVELNIKSVDILHENLEKLIMVRKEADFVPIITGYNYYLPRPGKDFSVSVSHIHGTELYKQDMWGDLTKMGYRIDFLAHNTHDKYARFLWDTKWPIRDSQGNVYLTSA